MIKLTYARPHEGIHVIRQMARTENMTFLTTPRKRPCLFMYVNTHVCTSAYQEPQVCSVDLACTHLDLICRSLALTAFRMNSVFALSRSSSSSLAFRCFALTASLPPSSLRHVYSFCWRNKRGGWVGWRWRWRSSAIWEEAGVLLPVLVVVAAAVVDVLYQA